MKVIGSANNIFGSYNVLFLLKFNFAAVEDESESKTVICELYRKSGDYLSFIGMFMRL